MPKAKAKDVEEGPGFNERVSQALSAYQHEFEPDERTVDGFASFLQTFEEED